MTFEHAQREFISDVMDSFLTQAKQASWATLWYQPSTREPDVVRLIAVMDNPTTLKELRKEQDAIVGRMKSQPETAAMRLFIELIPTREFHLRYQTQSGYELLREWNGDKTDIRKPLQVGNWIKTSRATKILLPLMIAGMLFFLVKLFAQHGI